MANKKIVTIGGGTGQFTSLSALKKIADLDITAVVSMGDSGGSTGRLRDEYGVLPPGDILKCLIALSPLTEARQILQTRFSSVEKLRNHNAGNFLLAILSQHLGGDFPVAIKALSEILMVKGRVLPVTIDKTTLVAELENGEFLYSETVIDLPVGDRDSKIKRILLVPHSGKLQVYPPVIDAIKEAEYIIIGPGDLYTSILPNFLVHELVDAIKQTSAKVIYLTNIMTKYGETTNFKASDLVSAIEKYLERPFDIVVANNAVPEPEVLEKYKAQKATLVEFDLERAMPEKKVIACDLLSLGDLARHDPDKLSQAISKIIF